MVVYEHGVQVRVIPVSTGQPSNNALTPAWEGVVGAYWGRCRFLDGTFADHVWYLFPGDEGSILIHTVPYAEVNGDKVYRDLEALGRRPVSKGCVRISPADGFWLRAWDPQGVPIHILPWTEWWKQ
jgi:hypothetical protein